MRINSPLRDPNHRRPPSSSPGVGGGGYWSTPLPPPPGLPNPPIFWSPRSPVPLYAPPSAILRPHQLAFHYFFDTQRAASPATTTAGEWKRSPRQRPLASPESPVYPVVGQKRPREMLPGIDRRQKMETSSNAPEDDTDCMGDSEMSYNTRLNKLKLKMIQTRKAKIETQLETSATDTEETIAIARENSLKDTSATSLPQNVHEEEIQAQTFVDQLITEGSNGKSVNTPKATCAGDSPVSSSNVPLNEHKTKLSQIKSEKRETREKTACMSDSEMSSKIPPNMLMSKMVQTRQAKRKAQLLEATTAIASPPQDVQEEEIVDQLRRTEEPKGKSVVEQEQKVDSSGGKHLDGPTETDDKVAKVGQYSTNPNISPIMEDIINKYGDIAKNSLCESNSGRSSILESICEVFQGLKVPAKHINPLNFKKYYKTVKNADKLGVNVKWLLERLDKHLATVRLAGRCEEDLRDAMKKNMELRDSIKKSAELKKIEVKDLKHEIQELENQLSLEISEIKRLKNDMSASYDKSNFFRDEGLMGGLL